MTHSQWPPAPRIKDEFWRPEDDETAEHDVRQAASLPDGRAWRISREFSGDGCLSSTDASSWCLRLLYVLLISEQPELAPAPLKLRPLVEGNELDAIDALMEPLDRAAAGLVVDVDTWWKSTKPRLDQLVDRVRAGGVEVEEKYWLFGGLLTAQFDRAWEQAWKEWRDSDGYPHRNGLDNTQVRHCLDRFLTSRNDGFASQTIVQLGDGRRGRVLDARWGPTGPPIAYNVRELDGRFLHDEVLPAEFCTLVEP